MTKDIIYSDGEVVSSIKVNTNHVKSKMVQDFLLIPQTEVLLSCRALSAAPGGWIGATTDESG